jgi:hypothetical membrane protein
MPRLAGCLIFLAGFTIIMGIMTAEVFYPDYNVSLNFISNLGSTPPPNSMVREPSAEIFDTIMKIAGVLVLIASFIVFKKLDKPFVLCLGLMGLGTLGVGVFPAYHIVPHLISAFIAFAIGGVAAILSFRVVKTPFSYLSVILGLITLGFLLVGKMASNLVVPSLGVGGTERWIAYPLMIWLTGLGGYLMNSKEK